MIWPGLNIFFKFTDGNFVVCFLVVKELMNLGKSNVWDSRQNSLSSITSVHFVSSNNHAFTLAADLLTN